MSRPGQRALGLLLALFVAAFGGLVLPTAPAAAAACPDAHGVTVIVDFHELGGGVQGACVGGGGDKLAKSLFGSAGFALEEVQRQPGFVCRVQGLPAEDPCVNTPPADAYWAVWWSAGVSGSWTYSTQGIGSLRIPDGGSVALSWNGRSGRVTPRATAPRHAARPTDNPSNKPTKKPGNEPRKAPAKEPARQSPPPPTDPSTASVSPSEAVEPTPRSSEAAGAGVGDKAHGKVGDKPGDRAGKKVGERPDHSPSPKSGSTEGTPDPIADPAPVAETPDPSDDGLPGWVGPVVVAVLFAAGAAVAVVRRRKPS